MSLSTPQRVNPVASQTITNNPYGELTWPLQQGDSQQLDLDRQHSGRLALVTPSLMARLETSLL